MKLLAVDASTEACSVALLIDDEVKEQFEIVPRAHTQRILPMVDSLLSEAGTSLKQLDALAFDRGPGSFTGVRVSTSVVQGLAFAADLPVIPVSSLAALAQAAFRIRQRQQVLALIDARMHEVYWGYYQLTDGFMRIEGKEHVSAVEQVFNISATECYVSGSGVQACHDKLAGRVGFELAEEIAYPHAQDIARLAQAMRERAVSAEEVEPIYLRDNVVRRQQSNK